MGCILLIGDRGVPLIRRVGVVVSLILPVLLSMASLSLMRRSVVVSGVYWSVARVLVGDELVYSKGVSW